MGTGKRKIEIKRREKEEQRMVTFSKRRKGLFKKAHELHCLTGADIAVVAFSPAGRPYTHGEPSIDATIDKYFNINGRESNNNNNIAGGGGGGGGGGGEEYYCKKAEMTMMASWLAGLKVEAYESVDDLVLVKNLVEEIRNKVLFRVLRMEEDFVGSLLA